MKYDHDRRERPARVREPVQVYLGPEEQARLDRLTEELSTSKSDVLRRGLESLERELTDPERHPALGVIGIADAELASDGHDPARDHDRALADAEAARWAEREPGAGGA